MHFRFHEPSRETLALLWPARISPHPWEKAVDINAYHGASSRTYTETAEDCVLSVSCHGTDVNKRKLYGLQARASISSTQSEGRMTRGSRAPREPAQYNTGTSYANLSKMQAHQLPRPSKRLPTA